MQLCVIGIGSSGGASGSFMGRQGSFTSSPVANVASIVLNNDWYYRVIAKINVKGSVTLAAGQTYDWHYSGNQTLIFYG